MSKRKRALLLQTCIVLLLIMIHQSLFSGTIAVQGSTGNNPLNGAMIDLFTQKEPHSGRGIDEPSDAFAPGSEVILLALVTYNEEPVEGMQVGFEVIPPTPIPEYQVILSAFTNESGIAMKEILRLPRLIQYPREVFFGTWRVVATVEVAETIVRDRLAFRVGWIVEIISVATIDENFMPKSYFPKATCIGAKLHIRNIAMLPKTATIVVTAFDALNAPFDSIVLNDFNVKPGDTYIFSHCFLNVSAQAVVGNAMLNASAYTAPPSMGGVPYFYPEVSAKFVITSRNVAVINVTASSLDVVVGDMVYVMVTVANTGNETETFSVGAYYGTFLIQTLSIASLSPNENRTVTFVWNTTYASAGMYIIRAVADRVPGEMEIEDNTKIDGTITVRPPRMFMVSRELFIVALIAAVALALFAIMLLLTGRKKGNPHSVMLNVDVLPS